jgi:hypothetical protein
MAMRVSRRESGLVRSAQFMSGAHGAMRKGFRPPPGPLRPDGDAAAAGR